MRSNFLKKIIAVLAVLGLLIFFNNYWTHNFLRANFVKVFKNPLAYSYNFSVNFKSRLVSWFEVDNIILENQVLSQENRRLYAASLKTAELRKENDLLRKELGVAQRRKWQLEIARIFQLNTTGPFRTALIDKGSNQGVQPGMAVVFEGDILLGVIKEVFPDSSLMFLLTDQRVAVSVRSKDSQISGRIKGALEEGLSLELITNREDIKIGDQILTSGLDGLPSLLIAGTVSSIKSATGDLFKTVKVEPAFNSFLPENVFVLKLTSL